MVLHTNKPAKDVLLMTTKQKIKHEIEVLRHLKSINTEDNDINFGANLAYDIMISRLKELLK